MASDLIPCLSIVSILIVIFGFLAFLRYMNYRETLALADKGLTRPEIPVDRAKDRMHFEILPSRKQLPIPATSHHRSIEV